jgi:hypothetical protein
MGTVRLNARRALEGLHAAGRVHTARGKKEALARHFEGRRSPELARRARLVLAALNGNAPAAETMGAELTEAGWFLELAARGAADLSGRTAAGRESYRPGELPSSLGPGLRRVHARLPARLLSGLPPHRLGLLALTAGWAPS